MKTKKLNELVNDFFGVSALIMCFFGVTLAMLISFTDNNDFSQGPINATMLLMLAVLILQTSKFIESSDNEAVHTEKQTLDTRLLELTNSLVQAGNAISAIEKIGSDTMTVDYVIAHNPYATNPIKKIESCTNYKVTKTLDR